jgi:hypothetical protein
MAGSNEVNLNESKVFSFISCPVLSSWRTFFHVFVLFFFSEFRALYDRLVDWFVSFYKFFFFFSGFGLFGFGKLEFREFEFHLGLLGTV